jgi:Zn-dependent M28 family amino/carboxypeptidase
MTKIVLALATFAVLLVSSCSKPESHRDAATPSAAVARLGPAPVATIAKVDAERILGHIRVLASDELEGRFPGTPGEEKTVTYLTAEMRKLGLGPGNTDGSFVQKVPLVGITATEDRPLVVTGGSRLETFRWRDDVVAWTKRVADAASIDASELVFVGHGIVAPEYDWDDFKGVDLKGKTMVVLVNDPLVPDPSDPSKVDPNVFKGTAMTQYGRWTYKYEEGARRGAAGVLIIHETGPAGYPFTIVQRNLGEKFDLVSADKNMGRASLEGWLSLDAAKRVLAIAGQDFDTLKKQATSRSFKPVPLGVKASFSVRNKIRTIDSRNVIGRLEGADPKLKDEHIVVTAHWDHLGIGAPVNGDRIYRGAIDNASGVATILEIARVVTETKPRPRRSFLFLAVTAEEQGLLGSRQYTTAPLHPLEGTVANINIDGINPWGRTKDVTVVGLGLSDLDDVLRDAAREQGRTLRPDPDAEKGTYYRSDHINFAKAGVPALYAGGGVDFIGKSPEFGRRKRDEYTQHDYHAPSDTIKPDWDLSGAAEDAALLATVGYRVANAETPPEWKPGAEFSRKRDAKSPSSGRRREN